MPDEIQTLNDDTSDIGLGSSPDDRPQGGSDDMISTLGDEDAPSSEGEAKTEEQVEVEKKEVANEAAAETVTAKAIEPVKPKPYHEDPAWQRIIKERDETKTEMARLQGQIDILTKMTPTEKKEAAKLPYTDITTMEDDDLREWQQNDPKGYAANLYAQITYEQKQEQLQQAVERQRQTQVQGVQQTFRTEVEKYAKDNADFMTMWQNGTIPRFMAQHPGIYNAMTAHRVLTEGDRISKIEAKYKAEMETALKAKEEEVIKNFKAKSQVKVLGEGPVAAPETDHNKELYNVKRGEEVDILAKRLERLRRASA